MRLPSSPGRSAAARRGRTLHCRCAVSVRDCGEVDVRRFESARKPAEGMPSAVQPPSQFVVRPPQLPSFSRLQDPTASEAWEPRTLPPLLSTPEHRTVVHSRARRGSSFWPEHQSRLPRGTTRGQHNPPKPAEAAMHSRSPKPALLRGNRSRLRSPQPALRTRTEMKGPVR